MTWTDPNNVTDAVGLLQWANTSADGFLGAVIAIAIFLVLFLTFKNSYTTGRSFAASATVTSIISVFLFVMGVLNNFVMYIFFIFTLIGLVALFAENP